MTSRRRICRLVAYLDEVMDDLRDRLPKAMDEQESDAVHDVRVATRRMRAAIDLLEPHLDVDQVKPFARSLRRVRRRLGPQRDIDVMREHLKDLRKTNRHEDAIDWLSKNLKAESSKSKKPRVQKTLDKLGRWSWLRSRIEDLGERLDTMLAESTMKQLHAFQEKADQLTKSSDNEAKLDVHEVRIEGKRLRYTLEMLRQHRPKRLHVSVLRTFKRMQDSLGLWHDYVVLAERAMCESSDNMLAHHDPRLQRQVVDLVGAVLRKADASLANFGKVWSVKGLAMIAAIEAACAPEPKITEPQTDRDQTGSISPPGPAEPPSIERGAA